MPPPARRHLIAERAQSRWRLQTLRWGIERVGQALAEAPYPRVLLKGAAYVAQALPIAVGRLPSDLDILVPRAHLEDALERLGRAGWHEEPLDPHDRRYYYEWSHEIPPLTHPVLAMELDLHHAILPGVAATTVDVARLLEQLRPSPSPGWHVLDRADQVLHCAAHLFLDAEPRDRLRDLVDLDGLLRHYGAEPAFWDHLPLRASELGLAEPLALASHFCRRWLATPIPPEVARKMACAGLKRGRGAWLPALFAQALWPAEPDDSPSALQTLAAQVLIARYHRQRLPLRLLVPHLWHKLRARRRAAPEEDVLDAPQR